jgi:hypothetical protein
MKMSKDGLLVLQLTVLNAYDKFASEKKVKKLMSISNSFRDWFIRHVVTSCYITVAFYCKNQTKLMASMSMSRFLPRLNVLKATTGWIKPFCIRMTSGTDWIKHHATIFATFNAFPSFDLTPTLEQQFYSFAMVAESLKVSVTRPVDVDNEFRLIVDINMRCLTKEDDPETVEKLVVGFKARKIVKHETKDQEIKQP